METKQIGPFRGINNRLPDFALVSKDGTWLREAENVEVDNAGRIRRRAAANLVQAMSGPHSLFLTSDTSGYIVRGGTIYAIALPTYGESSFRVLSNDDPMSWLEFNGDVFYSNGTDSGRISSGVVYPLGLPTPSAPSVATVGGGLFAGTYRVSVSYMNAATGEEGGVSASTSHAISTTNGLRVTLPGATAGATHVNVYVSTVNGGVPLLATTVAVGTATVDITADATGRESNGRFEHQLPAGRLFMANGRLCSIDGSTVYYGIPYRFGYYDPVDGRIDFPADVSIAISNQFGTYIVADKTYWIPGDLGSVQETIRDALPYGGVPGTAFQVPNKPIVGWFGEKGIVVGDIQGQVSELMADAIDQTPPESGVSFIVQSNGYRRVVSCGWCVNLESGATTHYANYPVTSASHGYGLTTGGLYNLAGTGAVDAHVNLGKNSFGTEALKRLPACYLGAASETPMELRITTPDDEDYRYEARSCGAEMRLQRVDPGKGLLANWYDLSLYNTEGSDFTLASVSFAPVASGRRI